MQSGHSMVSSSRSCCFSCIINSHPDLNIRSHKLHLKIDAVLWSILWFVRRFFWVNVFGQIGHLKILSFLWMSRWVKKYFFPLNHFSQWGQEYFFTAHFPRLCSLYEKKIRIRTCRNNLQGHYFSWIWRIWSPSSSFGKLSPQKLQSTWVWWIRTCDLRSFISSKISPQIVHSTSLSAEKNGKWFIVRINREPELLILPFFLITP